MTNDEIAELLAHQLSIFHVTVLVLMKHIVQTGSRSLEGLMAEIDNEYETIGDVITRQIYERAHRHIDSIQSGEISFQQRLQRMRAIRKGWKEILGDNLPPPTSET